MCFKIGSLILNNQSDSGGFRVFRLLNSVMDSTFASL